MSAGILPHVNKLVFQDDALNDKFGYVLALASFKSTFFERQQILVKHTQAVSFFAISSETSLEGL